MDLYSLPKDLSERPYSVDLEIDTMINIKTCWSTGERKTVTEMQQEFCEKLRMMIDDEQIDFDVAKVYEPDEVFRNVLDRTTGEVQRRHLFWILDKINTECFYLRLFRDHSEDYTFYDETDWEEGWKEWIEPEGRYSIVE